MQISFAESNVPCNASKEGRELKMKLVNEVKNGKSYEEALKEGQLELFELLKREAQY